jgi:predicted DNA-binding protein
MNKQKSATKRTLITVEIEPELKERLEQYSKETGVKIRYVVSKALTEYLNKVKPMA